MNVLKILTSAPTNMVLNNLFWAGCVAGRYELLWLTAPAILCYMALLVAGAGLHWRQLLAPAAVGITVDSLYTASGLFRFENHDVLLPFWMWSLWLAFATTLPLSLRLFGHSRWLAAVTGAIGFPISYWLGFQLGAIQFALPMVQVMFLIALTWALLLPVLFHLAFPKSEIINAAT